jgi:hypothetical protein
MVKLSVCSTLWEGAEVSRSVNVCEVVPCLVGVPAIAPVAGSSERLSGSSGETDQVYGSAPPEPLTEAAYGRLIVPLGSEEVAIVKVPGVGPLSPPQAVRPKIETLEKNTAQKI